MDAKSSRALLSSPELYELLTRRLRETDVVDEFGKRVSLYVSRTRDRIGGRRRVRRRARHLRP